MIFLPVMLCYQAGSNAYTSMYTSSVYFVVAWLAFRTKTVNGYRLIRCFDQALVVAAELRRRHNLRLQACVLIIPAHHAKSGSGLTLGFLYRDCDRAHQAAGWKREARKAHG